MEAQVYAKTAEGLDEMQARRARLHPRARSLLILIDGKQSVASLQKSFPVPELVTDYLHDLHEKGLIAPVMAAGGKPRSEATGPFTEQQLTLAPAGRAERVAAISLVLNDALLDCFGDQAGPHLEALERARHMKEYVAIANLIIATCNGTGRVQMAVDLKHRVRPLLR